MQVILVARGFSRFGKFFRNQVTYIMQKASSNQLRCFIGHFRQLSTLQCVLQLVDRLTTVLLVSFKDKKINDFSDGHFHAVIL